jgi:hypothetical protein
MFHIYVLISLQSKKKQEIKAFYDCVIHKKVYVRISLSVFLLFFYFICSVFFSNNKYLHY